MNKNNKYNDLDNKLRGLYQEHELSPPEDSWAKISAEFEDLDLAAFDKKIQDKIATEQQEVPAHLWAIVEENATEEKKKKKRFFYWWFLGALLLGLIYLLNGWQNQGLEKSKEEVVLHDVDVVLIGGEGQDNGVENSLTKAAEKGVGGSTDKVVHNGVAATTVGAGTQDNGVENSLRKAAEKGVEGSTDKVVHNGVAATTVGAEAQDDGVENRVIKTAEKGVEGSKEEVVLNGVAATTVGVGAQENKGNSRLPKIIETDSVNRALESQPLDRSEQKTRFLSESFNFLEPIRLAKINFTDSMLQPDMINEVNKGDFDKTKKLKIAIESILSMGYANSIVVDTGQIYNRKAKGNFLLDVGLRLSFKINERLVALGGIHYRNASSIHALYIPLQLRYKLGNKRIKPLVSLGVNISYTFLSEIGFSTSTNLYIRSIPYSAIRKLNISGSIGLGLEYQLTPKWALVFIPTFQYNFLNINKNRFLGVYPYSVQFDMGVKYFF